MKINLREIFDIDKIQMITDSFYAATGIGSAIIAINGEVLTGSGWQDACTRFHRIHPEALKVCKESDTLIRDGLLKGDKSVVYKCPHGLIDAAVPIIVQGRHVANFFTGQFLFQKPDTEELNFFEKQADKYGFDKKNYLEAILKLPIIPETRVTSILEFLSRFAQLISDMGYTNLQNRQYAKELKQSHEGLEKLVLERTASLHKTNLDLKKEIEQRKQAENILTAERIKIFNLLNSIPAFVCLIRSDYTIAFANQKFKSIFGDNLNRPCYKFRKNRDTPCTPCPVLEVFKTGLSVEREWKFTNGNTYQLYNYPYYDLNNEMLVLEMGIDITERKVAEERFKTFFSLVSDIFCIADIYGCFQLINPAAQAILGYSEEELLSKPHIEFVHPDDIEKTEKIINEQLAQGMTVFNFQNRYICKDGSVKWLEWTSHPIKDHGITYAVARDCTRRMKSVKTLEETMKELERSNTELEQFAYVASHDLQEPLRAIAGFLQLLQGRYSNKLDEKGHHYINRAVKASQRMQTLINDILTLSRVNTRGSKFVITDINLILERTLEEMEPVIRNTEALISCTKMPHVAVDANQIQSLFQNLIQNAIKYTGKNKPVIEIGCEQEDKIYRFYVKDNGIGIDPKFHERIFLVFQRLHTDKEYSGTGLGLALCKKIVERHGGNIWVESEFGKGSVFYFTLTGKLEL